MQLTHCLSTGPSDASFMQYQDVLRDLHFQMLPGQETSFIHAPSHNAGLLGRQFATLAKAGAHGVMLDVW